MIENFRAHPHTRAACLEAARSFEQCAAKNLVEAQDSADRGAADSALQSQAKTRLAQQHARDLAFACEKCVDVLNAG
jgi:hypothetical protein